MSIPVADLAEEMLRKSPPTFEVLKIFEFCDHVEPHDNNLQEKLEVEFNEEFIIALA